MGFFAIKECFGFLPRLNRKWAYKTVKNIFSSTLSFSIAFLPLANSIVPHQAYAQQIIIDPSAASSGLKLGTSSLGVPTIDITKPVSGVSKNKFSDFSVDSNGLILNNSATGGASRIGGNVNGNVNLNGTGPATVIVNEVKGINNTTLTGTTEVFGGKAAVIIANPNGIGCNGCSFINTSKTTLATGEVRGTTPNDLKIRVTKGSINIGRGGFKSEGSADLVGRNVIIDGRVRADETLTISGGSQEFNHNDSTAVAAPVISGRTTPFAVDASEYGALNAGQIRIHGNENGLGVNAYGDVNTSGDLTITSRGDLFYGKVNAGGSGAITTTGGEIRQYDDAQFGGDVAVTGGRFTLYKDRKLKSENGSVNIKSDDLVIIVGEVEGTNVEIDAAKSVTNNGFVFADTELRVIAGDDISNIRKIATEYDTYYDPSLRNYIQAYQTQLLSSDADESAFAAEMLRRAAANEVIEDYIQAGATFSAQDVLLEANLDIDLNALATSGENFDNALLADGSIESADIRNVGGAIVATRNITLRAGANIVNQFLSLRERLDREHGCTSVNCGNRTNFHAGEILSGGDINITAGLNLENRGSNIAAAENLSANAGRDIVNSLKTSQYVSRGVLRATRVTTSTTQIQSYSYCGKGCNGASYSSGGSSVRDVNVNTTDEEYVLSPGKIATLNGDLTLSAARDFVSIGSEVAAGGDLIIAAGDEVLLSSYSAVEEDFEKYNYTQTTKTCYSAGKNGDCTKQHKDIYVQNNFISFLTATSNLIGKNITLATQNDIVLHGTRIFADDDLNIQTTNGSILIDSIDLPDEVAETEFAEGTLLELDNQSASALLSDASLKSEFDSFIDRNQALEAVYSLSKITDANELRNSLRNVGLQGGRSIFEEDLASALSGLNNEVESLLHNIDAAAQQHLEQINAQISSEHDAFVLQLRDLNEKLAFNEAEFKVLFEEQLEVQELEYQSDLRAIKNAYDQRLIEIDEVYENTRTRTERRQVRERCGKDCRRTYYVNVVVDNPNALTVRNNALSNALATYESDISARDNKFKSDILSSYKTVTNNYENVVEELYNSEVTYQADLRSLENNYKARVAEINKVYENTRTRTETRRTRVRCGKDCRTWSYYNVQVENPNAIVIRDRDLATASNQYNTDVTNRDNQYQTATLNIKRAAADDYSDDALKNYIASEEDEALARQNSLKAEKTKSFETFQKTISDAFRVVDRIRNFEVQVNDLNNTAIAAGTAIVGDENAVTVLAGLNTNQSDQTELFDATRWRFANDNAIGALQSTPKSLIYADRDLSLTSGRFDTVNITDPDTGDVSQQVRLTGGEDIYITGATSLSAGRDIRVNAGRRFGLLGAINTNFGLGEGSHAGFSEIGKTLQAGTLLRAPDANEGAELTYDSNNNLIYGEEDDTFSLEYAERTRNYRLVNTILQSERDLSVNSNGDVINFGGTLISKENTYITAEGDIRNEVLRRNFTLTKADGCYGRACGGEGHDYKAAEILSGGNVIIASGGSIKNYGSSIGGAASIILNAEEDIINDAITSQYLYHYVNKSGFLKRRKEILHRAIIQEGNISSEFGSISLNAGRDIKNQASLISANQDVNLTAERDIELYAKSEEVHNFVKRRKIGFLSIAQQQTRYNEFDTALSRLEGNSISINANNDLTGIGASLLSAEDTALNAGNNLTFDAHQNIRYSITKGWSFGITFPGSNIIQSLVEGEGLRGALDEYISSNPVLAAVHQIATADSGAGAGNGVAKLAYVLPSVLRRAGDRSLSGEGIFNLTDGLASQFNPFDGLNSDFITPGSGSFLNGVTFRLGAYESSRYWTESHISQIISGNDLTISADNNINLVGGTVASAAQDASIYAGNDFLVTALADWQRSRSKSWGVSFGITQGGFTIGASGSRSSSSSRLYTNAGLTAGETLYVSSGRDTVFAGANVAARDIYIDTGRDLTVQSRQNVSTSESSGFNFSVTVGQGGVQGLSLGISNANANRTYTDTPTTIIAENTLDIYTEGTTHILGSVLNSESGDLTLNTGDLVFNNFNDVEQSRSFSLGVSLDLQNLANSDAHGSFAYSDKRAITYATVGLGEITVRNKSDFDFGPLNRDVNNVQRVIRDRNFAIEVPGINLVKYIEDLKASGRFIQAATAAVPNEANRLGAAGVDHFRDLILRGYSQDEIRAIIASGQFERSVRLRSDFREIMAGSETSQDGQGLTVNIRNQVNAIVNASAARPGVSDEDRGVLVQELIERSLEDPELRRQLIACSNGGDCLFRLQLEQGSGSDAGSVIISSGGAVVLSPQSAAAALRIGAAVAFQAALEAVTSAGTFASATTGSLAAAILVATTTSTGGPAINTTIALDNGGSILVQGHSDVVSRTIIVTNSDGSRVEIETFPGAQNGSFSISNARVFSGPNTAGVAASSGELRAAFSQLEGELDVSIETFPEHNKEPLILVTPVSDSIPEQEGFTPSSINLEDLILTTPIDDTPNTNAGFGEGTPNIDTSVLFNENGQNSGITSAADLISNSTLTGRTGSTRNFNRAGGFNQANADFDSLVDQSTVRTIDVSSGGVGRVGKLSDGRTIIVRETSQGSPGQVGPPTIEIQGGISGGSNARFKFRY